MKERPILFSAPMVLAILAGRKTQTRRICNPQPPVGGAMPKPWRPRGCPYGEHGDGLWCRETWAAPHQYDHLPPRLIPRGAHIHYAASEDFGGLMKRPSIFLPRWASRIDLVVAAARCERMQDITESDAIAEGVARNWMTGDLKGIAGTRDYDESLDGWFRYSGGECDDGCSTARESFATLIDSVTGPGTWHGNPWVWAVEFEVVK